MATRSRWDNLNTATVLLQRFVNHVCVGRIRNLNTATVLLQRAWPQVYSAIKENLNTATVLLQQNWKARGCISATNLNTATVLLQRVSWNGYGGAWVKFKYSYCSSSTVIEALETTSIPMI